MSEQSLADILDKLRHSKGFLNQTELAKELTAKGFKADKSQVNRWLSGERAISLEMLVGFIQVLNLNEEERNKVLRAAQQEKIIKQFSDIVPRLDRAAYHPLDEPISSNPTYGEFAAQLSVFLRIRDDASGIRLARQLGLDLRTVSGWLKGEARPAVPQLIDAIATGLNLDDSQREELLYAAGYGAYLEVETHPNSAIQTHFFDRFFHLLSQHPDRTAEIVFDNKNRVRILLGAATVIATGLVVVLFMTLFTPATLETLRGIIERSLHSSSTPTATPQPSVTVVPQTTMPSDTATPTPVTTIAPTLTASTVLSSATPTTAVIEPTPERVTVAVETPTPIPTQMPTPASEYPCEAEIVSPRGIWPLSVSFRNVPDGTSSTPKEFQSGDKVILQRVSPDGRWYEIADLNGRVLGWASPEFFTVCLKISQ